MFMISRAVAKYEYLYFNDLKNYQHKVKYLKMPGKNEGGKKSEML